MNRLWVPPNAISPRWVFAVVAAGLGLVSGSPSLAQLIDPNRGCVMNSPTDCQPIQRPAPMPPQYQPAPSRPAQSGSGYDFLRRDNPFGMAEQGYELPRLGQSIELPHLGGTAFQSRAPDGHGLIVLDRIDPGGALGRAGVPSGVVVNAFDTYHPQSVDQLLQILRSRRNGETVKLELLRMGPKTGFGQVPVTLQ